MRHSYFGNHLGRNTNASKALFRILTLELLNRGQIKTTVAKAKAIVPLVDRVISHAKKNTVASRREAIKLLGSNTSIDKLFNQTAPGFLSRNSGFTRIIRLGNRASDSAQLAIIELVEKTTSDQNNLPPTDQIVAKTPEKADLKSPLTSKAKSKTGSIKKKSKQ